MEILESYEILGPRAAQSPSVSAQWLLHCWLPAPQCPCTEPLPVPARNYEGTRNYEVLGLDFNLDLGFPILFIRLSWDFYWDFY